MCCVVCVVCDVCSVCFVWYCILIHVRLSSFLSSYISSFLSSSHQVRYGGELLFFYHQQRKPGYTAPASYFLLSGAFYTATTAMLVGWHSRASTAATAVVCFAIYYWYAI